MVSGLECLGAPSRLGSHDLKLAPGTQYSIMIASVAPSIGLDAPFRTWGTEYNMVSGLECVGAFLKLG